MKMSFSGGTIDGTVTSPPSKSHTHRAIFLASLANGKSALSNCLISDDTLSTIAAMRSIGASVETDGDKVLVAGGNLHAPAAPVDVGNSGTTLRIFTGIASIFNQKVTVTGDESLRNRPMEPLLNALTQMGVGCSSDKGKPPVEIKGGSKGGKVTVDGSISSQFISSLLVTAPMLAEDMEITVTGKAVSEPYIDVTTYMMRQFGSDARKEGNVFKVKGGTGYVPQDYFVPADFSSAAFPLVAGALGGKATVKGLKLNDPQGDRIIVLVLRETGALVSFTDDSVTVGKGRLRSMDVDVGWCPDLFPILAVLLSTAEGTSRLHDAPQLRFKESDRIKTTVNMLKAIGADASETDDGCIIRGRRRLKGGVVDNAGDHRIMMAAAVASLVCDNPVVMENSECFSISYPDFLDHMRLLGLKADVL
ncbi:MAG: 3-phosphoshikimate 1-carboxyvinyltransferase [Candidatus Methanoplasma sp.]|jgi:3-phosphoshikimate 1-carboxyvinyltransferase|nr:3-phosphoshikimate 1-carboxyvinyltransferase [Candidatus Methanoplasma sp.]